MSLGRSRQKYFRMYDNYVFMNIVATKEFVAIKQCFLVNSKGYAEKPMCRKGASVS